MRVERITAQDFDHAIEAFLAGKPIAVNRTPSAGARPSPRASVTQAIGNGEVTIAYGRPALKGRKVGELPPFQSAKVWRTGANSERRQKEMPLENSVVRFAIGGSKIFRLACGPSP